MARSKIAGITIEIGGDTTKLDRALEDTNKTVRSTQTELREVNKLLKMDPKNTELLTQKQKLLTEAVDATSERLDILKDAEKQVQKQFERGEVSEEQYRALKREIIRTSNSLEEAKKEAKETEEALRDVGKREEDLEKVSERADEFKEKVKATGEAIETGIKAAGAALGALGTYSVKFESEYDEAFNSLITATGAAEDKTDALNQVMQDVYKNNYGEDIAEVGSAIGTIVQQIGEMDPTKLQELTENAFALRDTFDMEVSESIRAVNQLTKQFGITSDEAFDLIAKGAQNGLNKNDNLLDSVNEYGPKFAQMGLSASDMFNMFKAGADAGIFDIDKLGDAVNEFSIRVKDGTADDAFKELGLDVEATKKAFGEGGEAAKEALKQVFNSLVEVSDPIEQNTMGVQLFGSMWEDTGGQAILAMGDMDKAASDAAGSMDKIKETRYDDLMSEISGLGRSIQTDLVKPLGEELTPIAKEVIDEAKDRLPQVKELLKTTLTQITIFITFFMKNANILIPLIAGIGSAMLTWKKVTLIQGMIAAFKKWTAATEGVTLAQKILNATILKNPLAWALTLIVGITTALVLLYKNCEGFRNFVNNLGASIAADFKALWTDIQNGINAAKTFFQENKEAIKNIFLGFVEIISAPFRVAWFLIKSIWDAVVTYFKNIWIAIQTVYSVVAQILGGYFQSAWIVIQGVWSVVVLYFQTIWQNIQAVFSVVATVLGGFFQVAWTTITTTWGVATGYFQMIWSVIQGIFSVVQSVLSGDFSGAWEAIKGIWSAVTGWFGQVWSGIQNIFGSVGSWFGSIFQSAWNAVQNVFSNWGSFFSGLWGIIQNTFSNLGTSIANAIGGAVKSGINGVISIIENTVNSAIGIINGAIGLINRLPGVSVGTLGYVGLPRLAKGGILTNGRAIVAEAGPEIVEMVNGKTIVTPLSGTAKNTALERNFGGQKGSLKQEISLNIENFYNNRKQDVRELTEEIMEIAQELKERDDKVYA